MTTATFNARRQRVETYFDRTALEAWKQLTADTKVSRIRQTVREGRDAMRTQILDWVAPEAAHARVLDAGCGTGALAVQLALRGAVVRAVDVSASLITVARERAPSRLAVGAVDFQCGDMLDAAHGTVDHAILMDSLIHYERRDAIAALENLAQRTRRRIVFTVAPATPLLRLMHLTGKLLPRGNRAPAIVPVAVPALLAAIARNPAFAAWRIGRTRRVTSGFYISHAIELVRPS